MREEGSAPMKIPKRSLARHLRRACEVTIGLALLTLVACGGGNATPTPPAANAPMPAPTLTTALPASTRNLDKVDTVFLQLLSIYQARGLDAAAQFARAQALMTAKDEIRVTLVLDSDDPTVMDGTALSVGRLGGRVTASYGNQVEIVVPVQTAMEYGRQAAQGGAARANFFADLSNFSHVTNIRRTPVAHQ